MPKKLTIEEVRDKFTKCGYELLEKEYKSARTKMLFKNKDGYFARVPVCHIYENLTLGTFFKKDNEYAIENVKTYLKMKTKCKLRTDNFDFRPDGFVPLTCKCGSPFDTLWHSIYRNNNTSCQDCINKESRGLNKIDKEEVEEKLFENGYVLLSEYKSEKISVEVLELKTGYIGFVSYKNIINNKTQLKPFILPLNEKNYIKNLNNFIKINNGNIKVLDYETKTSSSKTVSLKCKCGCGNTFTVIHGTIISNKGTLYCEECNKKLSNLERKTVEWLESNNIKYIRQHKFKDCKNILPLLFDFYIPSIKMCIECDGEQHHRGNTQYDKTGEEFDLRLKRDNIKDTYCKNNNIKLLRIPYWEFNKNIYKQILTDNILNQN